MPFLQQAFVKHGIFELTDLKLPAAIPRNNTDTKKFNCNTLLILK